MTPHDEKNYVITFHIPHLPPLRSGGHLVEDTYRLPGDIRQPHGDLPSGRAARQGGAASGRIPAAILCREGWHHHANDRDRCPEKGCGWCMDLHDTPSHGPRLLNYNFVVDGLTITDPSNIHLTRDVVKTSSIFFIEGGWSDYYKDQDVPHGTLSHVWYHCDKTEKDRRLTVYTPAGYGEFGIRYPVLYLLHGMGGDEDSWVTLGRAVQILDNLLAQGKAKPMIVVMTNSYMDLQAAPGHGPEGFIKPDLELSPPYDGVFEESFPSIIRYVDKAYHTIPRKQSRAIAGLSMGGFHAMQISRAYPDYFDYVGLFSAAVGHEAGDVPIYQNPMEKLRTQFSKKPALYWIAIGKEDFLYDANAEYVRLLETNRFRHEYFETDGGHTWYNWRFYLTEFLRRLF